MKRKGFTLVELLVVIAIIAILAAFLFPVFVAARERGKTARCVSNCRQIGVAMSTYAGDWSNWIPKPAFNEWDPPEISDQPCPYSGYEAVLSRYSKSWNIFYCPSHQFVRIDFSEDWRKFDPSNDQDQKGDVSYGINLGLTWPDPDTTGLQGGKRSLGELPSTANTIMLAESINGWHDIWDGEDYGLHPLMDAYDALERERHRGTSVYLFCDGHTATLDWDQTHSPHNLWTISVDD